MIWGCAGSGLHSPLHSETRASACTLLLSFSPGLPEVHCGEDVVSVSLLVGGGRAILRALQWFLQGKERTERENSRYHLELVIVRIRDLHPSAMALPGGLWTLFVPYMWLSNTAPTSALGLKTWVRDAFLSRQFLELQLAAFCFAKHN